MGLTAVRFAGSVPAYRKFLKRSRTKDIILFSARTPSKIFATMNVEHEVSLLVQELKRLGTQNADGHYVVKFGVLFNDDRCANIFEALVGTLKAAKRKKILKYDGELLLQGVHDNVDIVLLKDE